MIGWAVANAIRVGTRTRRCRLRPVTVAMLASTQPGPPTCPVAGVIAVAVARCRSSARLLDQAQPEVEQAGYTRVGDPVEDVVALPAGRQDPAVEEALQLVGHRLRAHPHLVGQVADTPLPS